MSQATYRLSKYIVFRDHNGKEQTLLQDQLFTWNGLRFVTVDTPARLYQIEVSRSKLNAAGCRMVPCDAYGKDIDLSPSGPDIEMPDPIVPSRKVAYSL